MVTFRYRTEGGWAELSVPMISLIPLPLLQITDANFKYDIRILGAIGRETAPVPRDLRDWRTPLGSVVSTPSQPTVMASFAPNQPPPPGADQQSPTLAANMSIAITMRRADVPAGIASLLNVAQTSIAGNPTPRLTLTPSVQTLDPRTPAVIYTAKVVDRTGTPQPGQLVTIALTPAVPLVMQIAAGTLVGSGPLTISATTDARGQVAARVSAASPVRQPVDATLTATAVLDQGNGQFGPETARALIQVTSDGENR